MESRGKLILAIIFIVLAVAVLLHQFLVYGVVFEWGQFLHHEGFACVLFALALGIIVGRD